MVDKKREKWQKEIYSHIWLERVNLYGLDDYCKGLIKLILSLRPKRAYELAIGTGWPFASTLAEQGITVNGSDISEVLIGKLHKDYPNIRAEVCTYEMLDKPDEAYDIVYCFRSTWYFPDIKVAINNMYKLAKKNGYICFDIMNKESDLIKRIVLRHTLMIPMLFLKNSIKYFLNVFSSKSYTYSEIKMPEIPVSHFYIDQIVNTLGMEFKKYSVNQIEKGFSEPYNVREHDGHKIIYLCHKV